MLRKNKVTADLSSGGKKKPVNKTFARITLYGYSAKQEHYHEATAIGHTEF
jgi:hypothetical protein